MPRRWQTTVARDIARGHVAANAIPAIHVGRVQGCCRHPLPLLKKRIYARSARDGDYFKISTELVAFYFDHFEVPTAAEGPLTVRK